MGVHVVVLLPGRSRSLMAISDWTGPERPYSGTRTTSTCSEVGCEIGGDLRSSRASRTAGTLIKMYDYKAPRSNICGELFKKLEDYLLRPAFPLRLMECRPGYSAKVMGVNVWDRLGAWAKNKLEPGFEEGASIQNKLSTG